MRPSPNLVTPTPFCRTLSSTAPSSITRPQIYGAQSASSVRPGDLVRLTGTISEYASLETGLHLTELVFPSALAVMSHGHELKPIVLGVDRVPPGERIYVQDQLELKPGIDIEADGEPLEVKVKGLAFWESCVVVAAAALLSHRQSFARG